MTGSGKLALGLATVLALAGSHWYALDIGRDLGAAACAATDNKRKDAVIGAINGRVAENAAEQKQNEAKARKVSNAVQTELADVRSYQPPATGVRFPALPVPRCDPAGGQAQATGAGGPDGAAAGAVVFPEEIQRAVDRFTEGVGRLEKEADGVAAIARGHQQFARENGLYGDAKPEGEN